MMVDTDGRFFVAIKIGRHGQCALAHPLAEVGEQLDGTAVWIVTHCPAVVTAAEVFEAFAAAAIWRPGQYRVRFAELRPGGVLS